VIEDQYACILTGYLVEIFSYLNTFHVQVLINQLKEVAPAIQKSISECTDKVQTISSTLPPMTRHRGQSTSPIQAQSTGRTLVILQ
jgi:hypothetical protein